MFTTAIILAAGSSSRMGRDKILADLCGTPVLMYSVRAFEQSSADEIIIAASESNIDGINTMLSGHKISKPVKVITGGATRCLSAINAVKAADSRCEIVSIHDGARPLVTPALIDSVTKAAEGCGGAIAAVRAKDTIKVCDGEIIKSTPDREKLWQAQTPQAFFKENYLAALESADNSVTDDAGIMESAGYEVRVVEGDYRNIKLTSPEDFITAAAFIGTAKDTKGKKNMLRIGHGYDVHRFEQGRRLVLCGEEIKNDENIGLLGHSDADVAVHALMDAMLGALALGDIGKHFPDSDEKYKGISSMALLDNVVKLIGQKGARLSNADITIIAEKPKLARYIEKMRQNLANALGTDISCISVKATTEEGLGIAGQGIAAHAVCVIEIE